MYFIFVDLTETPTGINRLVGVVYYKKWQNIATMVQMLITHSLFSWSICRFSVNEWGSSVILAYRLYAMYGRQRRILVFLVSISHSASMARLNNLRSHCEQLDSSDIHRIFVCRNS